MKTRLKIRVLIGSALILLDSFADAAVRYVNVNSSAPTAPYTNWSIAANVIQDAIDAASAGDEIVVTNGVYQSGGAIVAGLSNRVAITKALTLRSVYGPLVTIIRGENPTNLSALRGVYLTNGAQLVGFTLTDGSTSRRGGNLKYPPVQGGGAWCESQNAVISNCIITGNSAATGGGTWSGTLNNCELISNIGGGLSGWLGEGGGAVSALLNNCLVRGNISETGGGAFGSVLNNCTLVENFASHAFIGATGPAGAGAATSTLNNCVVYFNNDWLGDSYSDCLINYSCTPLRPTNGVGNITNAPLFVDAIAGDFRLHSNSPCINSGRNANAPVGSDLDGNLRIVGGTVDMGAYELQATERYVNVSNPNPSPPYTNWAMAANVIQDAIDVAQAGDEIIVTNGIYQTGGRTVQGMLTNRVAVTKPLTLRSVNGPAVTVIRGYQVPSVTNGNGAVRCVYLTIGATLHGFTLADGATRKWSGPEDNEDARGGGVFCQSGSPVVSNCVLSGNSADWWGGGAYGGTLNNCVLTGNSAMNGGAGWEATMNNCVLAGNIATESGGGSFGGVLNNCTITGNAARYGGGVASQSCPPGMPCSPIPAILDNCVLYLNTATLGGANYGEGGSLRYPDSLTINHSCTTPLPTTGIDNITNAPLFLNAATRDFRLQRNSPCINTGRNADAPAGLDLKGNPRIVGGTVDMGAYEFQSPQSAISYAWLQQFGFPTDGSVDHLDPDRDGHSNWQEWRVGTDPSNANSLLRLLTPLIFGNGVAVRWQSVSNRTYYLERSSNITQHSFHTVATNVIGQAGVTMFTDTNAPSPQSLFYRVRVEE